MFIENATRPNSIAASSHASRAKQSPAAHGGFQRIRNAVLELNHEDGLGPAWLTICFLAALLLIILRSPSMFTHAQFWAEDGKLWYAQAYSGGWLHSLTLPDGGYLNTLQRLIAGISLLVPFHLAPLTMAICGLVLQALPVLILLSCRSKNWAPLSFRILFAAVYIAIPNARELHIVCTNSHFHLAVVELLLALSVPPRSFLSRALDVIVFLLAGVSGPFAVILIPLLLVFWFVRRQRWSLVQLALMSIGTVVQLYFLSSFHTARTTRPLGATWAMFTRLLGGNVFLGALRGSTAYGSRYPLIVCLAALLIGLVLLIYCARFVSLEVRIFFVYCSLVFAASLKSPLLPYYTKGPQWMTLLIAPSLRYWFFPSLAFLFALLWCMCFAKSRPIRWLGAALALLLCQGIWRDWRVPPMQDLHFQQYAAQFEAAPPGTRVIIPLNPPTGEWYMELTKK